MYYLMLKLNKCYVILHIVYVKDKVLVGDYKDLNFDKNFVLEYRNILCLQID